MMADFNKTKHSTSGPRRCQNVLKKKKYILIIGNGCAQLVDRNQGICLATGFVSIRSLSAEI